MIIRCYKCVHCRKEFDYKVSIKEPIKKYCEICGNQLKIIYKNNNKAMIFNNPFMGVITRTHGNN